MYQIDSLIQNTSCIESLLGYQFKNPSLLILAFIHCSYINENKDVKEHNERLEFLGDSVLGLMASNFLYCNLPVETPEGDLSYIRSRLVEASSCARYLQKLSVASYLLLGKGERRNDGKGRESIHADLFEALIGAVYLDGGLEAAERFWLSHFSEEIKAIIKTPLRNWKSLLQDYCQKKFHQIPFYSVVEETGPQHNKQFKISVLIQDQQIGFGEGTSKKEAQQAAAANACEQLNCF